MQAALTRRALPQHCHVSSRTSEAGKCHPGFCSTGRGAKRGHGTSSQAVAVGFPYQPAAFLHSGCKESRCRERHVPPRPGRQTDSSQEETHALTYVKAAFQGLGSEWAKLQSASPFSLASPLQDRAMWEQMGPGREQVTRRPASLA